MRPNYLKTTNAAVLAATVLVAVPGLSFAQTAATVSLTASRQSTTLPDGNAVPMWGWTCGDALATPVASVNATCSSLSYLSGTTVAATPQRQIGGTVWQPPLITIPYNAAGTSLTITLTNTLPVETSLAIIGQASASSIAGNGGLGAPVREGGPRTDGDHQTQTAATWTTVVPASAAPNSPVTGFTPPTQGARIRSFVQEAAGVATVGATPATVTYTWANLQRGTYLIRTGTYPSIQSPMGLYGVLVVTQAPAAGAPGIAYPAPTAAAGVTAATAVTYDADVVALESEIDARQNNMVAAVFPTACTGAGAPVAQCTAAGPLPAGAATANTGFSETAKWNLQCGAGPNGLTSNGTPPTCYPPAVDYTPLYFLVNGVAFSKDNQQASALPVPASGATGNVLVRFVNAGSHMHIPSVNNLNELEVAEDADVLPDVIIALSHGKTLTGSNINPPAGAAQGLQLRDEAWMAAGKVMDVIVSPTQTTAGTYDSHRYVVYDHSLSGLSTDNQRDGGMQFVLDVNDSGGTALAATNASAAVAADAYQCAPGITLTVSDPAKGVIGKDTNVYGVTLVGNPANNTLTPFGGGSLTLNPDGTFTYTQPSTNTTCGGTFTYYANGNATLTASVTVSPSTTLGQAPTANPDSYTSPVASIIRVDAPGVLGNDTDPNGYPLTAQLVGTPAGVTVHLSADGTFTAIPSSVCVTATGCTYTFNYQAKNSEGTPSNQAAVTLTFLPASNLAVTVQDAQTKAAITDYKWIIQQDLTFHIDPSCQQNGAGGTKPATCPAGVPPTLGTNFHTSYMPVVATGCTGAQSCGRGQSVYDPVSKTHVQAACDGFGICTVGATQNPASFPSAVNLPATDTTGVACAAPNSPAGCNANYGNPLYYYISILPGDAQNPFSLGNVSDPLVAGNCTPAAGQTEPTGFTTASTCGHTMGGAPIAPVCTVTGTTRSCTLPALTISIEPTPLRTSTVTVFVFEDDFPTNGEPDTGGGVDTYPTQEVGLEDFQVIVWDLAGCVSCDNTGQDTYDMFNVPLTNALNGTIDPTTGLNACPISNTQPNVGIGMIIVCPKFEADGKTLSPLVGNAVIRNLNPGLFDVTVHPGAAREGRGEEWLQTNTLDGSPKLDAFVKAAEPAYFQEYGPGGFHVFFGEANPAIINARLPGICNAPGAPPCGNTIHVQTSNLHQGRTPDERLWTSGVFPQGNPQNYAALNYSTCWGTIGDTDGVTFQLVKCDPNGNLTFTGIPDGSWGVTMFDQWLDLLVDGSSRVINVSGNNGGKGYNMEYGSFTWQSHIWNRTYMDLQGLGTPVLDSLGNLDPFFSPGLIQVPTRVRMRNGSFNNTLFSDVGGNTHFDETFPLFNWYVVESDTTRFRSTGVHVVNDAGGQLDGPAGTSCMSFVDGQNNLCGNGNDGTVNPDPYQAILNSNETFSLPADLQVPGAVYCPAGDPTCATANYGTNPGGNAGSAGSCGVTAPSGTTIGGTTCTGLSTARIDPGSVEVEGWQGGVSEYEMLDWGKQPYMSGETGGIRGHVVNATTRPFDDPRMLFQNLWEPLVPRVTVNLYQETTAPDGTTSLKLVDTTQTASWDDWAQGFGAGGRAAGVPNMSCPGEDFNDPFYGYTMYNTPNYLQPGTTVPHNSQFKCFDGFHNLSQVQPATYDGLYEFPSQTCLTSGATFTVAGNPTVYTCATVPNPAYGYPGQTGAKPAVLPPGKYVTEVVLPKGYELTKEEDLNLLIGDNFIAPVAAQFGSLANIFITPDQASIDAANPSYTGPYTAANPYTQPFTCTTPTNCTFTPTTTNNGKQSTNYGRYTFGSFGPGGLIQQSAPCVGMMRIVPDYLSIAPESGEVAPFAGALRALCDRKEVTLDDQMQANADFFIYPQTPAAASYTGFVTDDFASEFDPSSPQFGEKFAVTNVPIGIKDYNGVEVARTYADQWGTFNGVVYSTWQVNPPNITGYGPNVMIFCMNDPGPIKDTNPSSPTYGQMITDPYFNPNYSDFCYEWSLMPGNTAYLDTPVVPTAGFAEGYNPPDCDYPDATPRIAEVDGDGVGPWVSAPGKTIKITALGDQMVQNDAYSGPAATTPPYNLKTITRHYGFGTSPTVTIGGATATCTGTDLALTCTVPANVPLCRTSNPTYAVGGASNPNYNAQCGELVLTNNTSGKQSIDTVTVTVGGTPPKHVAPTGTIQAAIDAAAPGDLIIVDPTCALVTTATGMSAPPIPCNTAVPGTGQTVSRSGRHNEMLIMWKPVRLQGVGAATTIVDANTNPAGRLLDPWRRNINCLFGLSLNGALINNNRSATYPNGTSAYNPYDPSGQYKCNYNNQADTYQVDPIPLEPIIGWVASLNGNIAELLQEPSLMGAYEGAALTVLGRGWEQRVLVTADIAGTNNAAGTFTGTLLTTSAADCAYVSNFLCAPSRVDGMSLTDSSQGGGGIFLHGWIHYLELANNRVYNNGGTLAGGITVGQAETPPATIGTDGFTQLPFLFNQDVSIHHNSITHNTAYGDELNSNTPAAAGGVTMCDGTDYYKFNYNWVCGNLSMGDGGGVAHFGFSYDGLIDRNWIVFNQSTNPTLTTYGGGLIAEGVGPDGTLCETSPIDVDCPPQLPDGVGPGLLISNNVLQGNTAEGGSGGGLRLQKVNGTEVQRSPTAPGHWYSVDVRNNIIANNVAGWGGGGVSLEDSLLVSFTNNTVVSNDVTATAGVLFDTTTAPNANIPPPGCDPTAIPPPPACTNTSVTKSPFMVAGLQAELNSGLLTGVMTAGTHAACPLDHPNCDKISNPFLTSDIFWQNRSFHITTGAIPAPGLETTVNLVPAMQQTATGACASGANYWDIGVYGDTTVSGGSGYKLSPMFSTLTSVGVYTGAHNTNAPPGFRAQYCNGSRVPPEIVSTLCAGPNGQANAQGCVQPGAVGISLTVPPGITDSIYAGPAFSLTPAATVDEGSNWINMFYGPLSLSNPTVAAGTSYGGGAPLGQYNRAGAGNGAHLPAPYPNP